MKYWNKARVKRTREREAKRRHQAFERHRESERRCHAYTRVDARRNAELILDVLGTKRHRHMLAWLRTGGAMSVTKFAKPFGLTLPAAMRYVHLFERTGIISTHKRGRIRFCVYERKALERLAGYVRSRKAFLE